MSHKLTLTIDERIISFAKDYSRQTHQSISAIVQRYFDRLQQQIDLRHLSPESAELYGMIEGDLPDKRSMREAFHEKARY